MSFHITRGEILAALLCWVGLSVFVVLVLTAESKARRTVTGTTVAVVTLLMVWAAVRFLPQLVF